MLSLTISLDSYVPNGEYNVSINVTWISFLHSCGSLLDRTYSIKRPYNTSILVQKVYPNSQYNITVMVTNALGSVTMSLTNTTMEAGKPTIMMYVSTTHK